MIFILLFSRCAVVFAWLSTGLYICHLRSVFAFLPHKVCCCLRTSYFSRSSFNARLVALDAAHIFIFFFLTSKPGEELDWDEEFALQDFLKSELEERNCREQRGGQTDGNHREVVDKSAGSHREVEEEKEEKEADGGGSEERWMVVDTAEEAEGEARATSTPVSGLPAVAQPAHGEARGGHGEYNITATAQCNGTFSEKCILNSACCT